MLLLSTLACDGDDCEPLDLQNGVDPVGGTPAVVSKELGRDVWLTMWDNPVVGGWLDLPYRPVEGYAIRSGTSWEYNKFDLTARVTGAGLEAPLELYTWPGFPGKYGDDEGSFQWETHGLKLVPRVTGEPVEAVTSVQAWRDDWDTPELPYLSPGAFELDPAVVVVPVRVVVLYPTPADPHFSASWVSQELAELVLDDQWQGYVQINTDWQFSPDNVIGTWTTCADSDGCEEYPGTKAEPARPDRVFDQCGVQFRMVSYHAFPVPADDFFETQAGACNDWTKAGTWSTRAAECGVPRDDFASQWVIFGGELVFSQCVNGKTYGAYNPTTTDVAITYAAVWDNTLRYVLAHELGHALGLDHVDPCPGGELMCVSPFEAGPNLTSDECAATHGVASSRFTKFWGP